MASDGQANKANPVLPNSVIAIGLVRLTVIHKFTNTYDPAMNLVPIGLWSGLEIDVGVICASLPTIRILLKPMLWSTGPDETTYKSASSKRAGGKSPSSSPGLGTYVAGRARVGIGGGGGSRRAKKGGVKFGRKEMKGVGGGGLGLKGQLHQPYRILSDSSDLPLSSFNTSTGYRVSKPMPTVSPESVPRRLTMPPAPVPQEKEKTVYPEPEMYHVQIPDVDVELQSLRPTEKVRLNRSWINLDDNSDSEIG
jgi:hypothetical protein